MQWIYPPTIPWESEETVYQRPQQLFQALAAAGEEAIFVERDNEDAARRSERGVQIVPESYRPRHHALGRSWLWVTHPPHYQLQSTYRTDGMIFDFMDDTSDEFGVWDTDDLQHCLTHADLVTVVSQRLLGIVRKRAPQQRVLLLPNAADVEHFAAARQQECPPELLDMQRPCIGFMGSISTWIDYVLLWKVIANFRDATWLFIGPDYLRLGRLLRRFPHVKCIGPRSYDVLPAYVGRFDVGIIPFQVRTMTHSSSPLKMYEYLAAGLPVISTPIAEAICCPQVQTADTVSAWCEALTEALRPAAQSSAARAERQAFARQESWGARVSTLLSSARKEVSCGR